ncbi:hypothetical protein ACWDUI_23755 [Streptosporangium sandarakinum]
MTTAERLRVARDAFDDADAELRTARRAFDAARDAYDSRRRYAPSGGETERARTAMALAGHAWLSALVERERLRDELESERRDSLWEQETRLRVDDLVTLVTTPLKTDRTGEHDR